jgi:dethiobiotin synthetase
MIRGLFVTGTDTGVGKTVVSALLLRALRQTRARRRHEARPPPVSPTANP